MISLLLKVQQEICIWCSRNNQMLLKVLNNLESLSRFLNAYLSEEWPPDFDRRRLVAPHVPGAAAPVVEEPPLAV
jgi:hypothetical protein